MGEQCEISSEPEVIQAGTKCGLRRNYAAGSLSETQRLLNFKVR